MAEDGLKCLLCLFPPMPMLCNKSSFSALKKKRKLGIIKEVKDLRIESYRKLMKDTSKWKNTLFSWTEEINIFKMCMLHKAIYRFRTICIKIPMIFLYIKKKTLKCIWN
jgi:hypothetical protein